MVWPAAKMGAESKEIVESKSADGKSIIDIGAVPGITFLRRNSLAQMDSSRSCFPSLINIIIVIVARLCYLLAAK